LFASAGLRAEMHVVQRGSDLPVLSLRAAANHDVVVAAGGDGTVSAVASAAVQSGARLGVIAAGTLNHFARDAGLPVDPAQAVGIIANGQVREVDVAEVNGRIFVNNSSIGLYPRLVWEREQERRRGRGKWPAFAIALARTWRRYRLVTVRLVVDGRDLVRRTPFVFIGNGDYRTEGLSMGGRAHMSGGRLSVFVAPQCGQFEILTLPGRALLGRLETHVNFESFTAADVTIEPARPHLSVAMDGEIALMEPPLRYRSRPAALRLLAPACGGQR
jgi:diacylglycerol kinase family enzyme